MKNGNFDPAEWSELGEHLTEDGDILFYGCNTAANAEGQQLLEKIAEASGADVAASTDTTGISGNWDLEYTIGNVDAEEIVVENFEHNLTNYTVTNLDDSGAGSLRQAVSDAMDMSLSELRELVRTRRPGMLQFMGSQRVGHD